MRVQYASDLHLEFGWFKSGGSISHVLRPVAPVLVLAGDIGNPQKAQYTDFLRTCATQWEHIIVVAGNHEFYNKRTATEWEKGWGTPDSVADRLEMCRAASVAAGDNVHFLDRGSVDIGGVRFLGCTLWSDTTGAEELIERRMADCRVICPDKSVLKAATAEDLKTWHVRDRDWLVAELDACRAEGRGAVVVTHHLPSFDLVASRWAGNPLNAGFASALDDLIEEPVRTWICGHTHTAGIVHKGAGRRIPCVLNPRGYPDEEGCGYRPDIFVDVRTEYGAGEKEIEPGLAAAAEEVEFL